VLGDDLALNAQQVTGVIGTLIRIINLNTINLPPIHIRAPAYEEPFAHMHYVGGTNGPIRNYNLDMGLTGYTDPFGPDTPALSKLARLGVRVSQGSSAPGIQGSSCQQVGGAHSATLKDYKLRDDGALLYTQER
jgi:hypothetical protein